MLHNQCTCKLHRTSRRISMTQCWVDRTLRARRIPSESTDRDTEISIFGGGGRGAASSGARLPSVAASALTKLQTAPTVLMAPDAAVEMPDEALSP